MPPSLSQELRDRIEDHFERLDDTKFIHEATGVSVSQIRKMRKCWEETGLTHPPQGPRGKKKLILSYMEEDLLAYLELRPTAYLDEMAWFLLDEHGVVVSESVICRTLKAAKWSRKKVDLSSLFPV